MRPRLPWAQKIILSPEKALPILDKLFSDKTRYVTRSVANHMNDISKVNPELVLETLARWQKSNKQDAQEMDFIIKHSLRSLVKMGNKQAMEFLSFSADPEVVVSRMRVGFNIISVY
jgi:3-methyladenine DNA glycosylase AlkC